MDNKNGFVRNAENIKEQLIEDLKMRRKWLYRYTWNGAVLGVLHEF